MSENCAGSFATAEAGPAATKNGGASGEVEQQEFARLQPGDGEPWRILEFQAVTAFQLRAVHVDPAADHLNPRAAAGILRMDQRGAGIEQAGIDLRILVDVQGAVLSARSDDDAKPVALLRVVEPRLAIGGRQALCGRQHPDLQEAHRLLVRAVELAMPHAGAGRHRLHVAAPDDAFAAGGVAMRQGALHDIGVDLHVAVTVGRESAAGGHRIVVDHPQAAEAHMRRVVVMREGEGMAAVEPIQGLAAALFRWAMHDGHDVAPLAGSPRWAIPDSR